MWNLKGHGSRAAPSPERRPRGGPRCPQRAQKPKEGLSTSLADGLAAPPPRPPPAPPPALTAAVRSGTEEDPGTAAPRRPQPAPDFRFRPPRSPAMEEPEMQLKGKKVTDKFTESVYVLANEPSVALYRLQEHVRRSLPELAQHKADMQRWEEQSQGAIYTVEYACSAVKSLVDSGIYFRSVEGLLKQAISIRDHMNATSQGHR
ncbi:BLOC-1-related complex subunit 8 [Thomomys bottae]